MAMIFGRFTQMTADVREALFELSHEPTPSRGEDPMIRIRWGAEQLYRAAAEVEPDARFSTLCTAVKELAWEAAELGLLTDKGGPRANHRMKGFGLLVHPRPDGGQKRQIIFLRDGLAHIDRWKALAKLGRGHER